MVLECSLAKGISTRNETFVHLCLGPELTNPEPKTNNFATPILNPKPQTLNPQRKTPNPKPSTLNPNPKPSTLKTLHPEKRICCKFLPNLPMTASQARLVFWPMFREGLGSWSRNKPTFLRWKVDKVLEFRVLGLGCREFRSWDEGV